MGESAQE
jgi:hypothetical protein